MAKAPFAAEFGPVPTGRRRRAARASVVLNAGLGVDGRAFCRVVDLSQHGARLEAFSELLPGARIWLTLPGLAPRVATVRWSSGFDAGCEFDVPLAERIWRTLCEEDGAA